MVEWKKRVLRYCSLSSSSPSSSASKLVWFFVPFLMAFGIIVLQLGSRSSTLLFFTRWKGGGDINNNNGNLFLQSFSNASVLAQSSPFGFSPMEESGADIQPPVSPLSFFHNFSLFRN